MTIDCLIAESLGRAGIDLVLSLPCNMLSGILAEIDRLPIRRIAVCREEEGVGIAAGAALAGRRPLLLMQNSGLGNCVNALASLTCFYVLPLFMLWLYVCWLIVLVGAAVVAALTPGSRRAPER